MRIELEEVQDLVLPMLDLPDPCLVKIEVIDDMLFLWIGPRDWQWDFKTGELIGQGTALESGEED